MGSFHFSYIYKRLFLIIGWIKSNKSLFSNHISFLPFFLSFYIMSAFLSCFASPNLPFFNSSPSSPLSQNVSNVIASDPRETSP